MRMFLYAAPGRRQRITDELRRARAATGVWIDTDFYKDFLQVGVCVRRKMTVITNAENGKECFFFMS